MAWVARNSDNTPRTPSPYVRHNEDNVSEATGLLEENAYVSRDVDNVADSPQPGKTLQTDAYGNQFYDWSADYVRHDETNTPG